MFQFALYKALQKQHPDERILLDLHCFNGYHKHRGFEIEKVFGASFEKASLREVAQLAYPYPNFQTWRIGSRILPIRKTMLKEKADFTYDRAIPFYIVRNQWADEIAGTGLFEFRPLGRMFPPAKEEKWDAQKIRGMVTENAEYAPLFQKAQEERAKELAPFREAVKSAESEKEKDKRQEALKSKLKETPSEDSKRFLREWLDHEGAALRDKLADAYRAAYYANASAHIYAGELYQDTLFSSYDSRIYKPSPFAEDGILTAATRKAEELRRVKFSRGYDADERVRLLAELGEG